MTTYSFLATSSTASGSNTMEHTQQFDSAELAQAYITEWTQALNGAGYNGANNWTVVVNGQQD